MAKCVEITMLDDGTFTVKECEPKQEMGEEGGEYGEAQATGDVNEALAMAGQILGGGGEQEAPSQDEQDEQAAFGMFDKPKGA